MKKSLFILSLLFSFSLTFANPVNSIKEYTLENNMSVFLLEDPSDALVHIDFSVRAGFSSQDKDNAGFFKLYSRLLNRAFYPESFDYYECNADSSRYKITISPQELSDCLTNISETVFNFNYSDEILSEELSGLKKEVSDSTKDLSYLINSAIDSKVFSDAPWKNDSGIYPPLFKKTTVKQARTILENINQKWYTPQNSAIFIYGNINAENTYSLLKNSFGRFYSNFGTPIEKPAEAKNAKRKFVIHDPEFSKELTQVVVQYTTLQNNENTVLAEMLNNPKSTFKQNILMKEELNIPGDEYINISSVHKRNCSRLIFQTLIQEPENKKIKTNSCRQVASFEKEILDIPSTVQSIETAAAKKHITNSSKKLFSTPADFMETLASFWAYYPYSNVKTTENPSISNSLLTDYLILETNNLTETDDSYMFTSFSLEQPFIFVIINSEDFKKNKKEYTNNGYIEINSKNSSWYVQELYKNQNDLFSPEEISNHTTDYYALNADTIKSYKISSNNIPVYTKKNNLTDNATIMLSVKGGKLNSADNHGFEEVMVNLLGSVIQRQINIKASQGILLGGGTVKTQSQLYTSTIAIDCQSEDIDAICQIIAQSIIYEEILPAQTDRAVSSRQYKKRLENGSAVNQMYSGVIRTFFGISGDFVNIFETKKDILQNTTYKEILAAYPPFLDACRYSIIITGNFDDSITETIEKYFGQLNQNNVNLNVPKKSIAFPKNKSVPIKIVHTFLTDIPAEKAGPMPAVLIPTTEFLDPVIYSFIAPEQNSKDYVLFNSMMNYLEYAFQKELMNSARTKDAKVRVQLPPANIPAACLIIENVKYPKEIDAAFRRTVTSIEKQLSSAGKSEQTCNAIKNYWLKNQMEQTSTNYGTALLIQKGIEYADTEEYPLMYLQEYNYIKNADQEAFLKILKTIPYTPDLRLYSTDAKN